MPTLAWRKVNLDTAFPSDPKKIEQMNQHQLCIRVRVDPQFHRFALLAKLNQAEALLADFSTSPVEIVQPMRDRVVISLNAAPSSLRTLRRMASVPKRT